MSLTVILDLGVPGSFTPSTRTRRRREGQSPRQRSHAIRLSLRLASVHVNGRASKSTLSYLQTSRPSSDRPMRNARHGTQISTLRFGAGRISPSSALHAKPQIAGCSSNEMFSPGYGYVPPSQHSEISGTRWIVSRGHGMDQIAHEELPRSRVDMSVDGRIGLLQRKRANDCMPGSNRWDRLLLRSVGIGRDFFAEVVISTPSKFDLPLQFLTCRRLPSFPIASAGVSATSAWESRATHVISTQTLPSRSITLRGGPRARQRENLDPSRPRNPREGIF